MRLKKSQSQSPEARASLARALKSTFFRYLVAERDFDEGELIFHENALGVGPNPESTLQCILCSKKACITQCLKITEKVSFNITSEASYIYVH